MSDIIESYGNCPECLGTPELVGNMAACRRCKTRWTVEGVSADVLEHGAEQLRLILAGFREVRPAAVLADDDTREDDRMPTHETGATKRDDVEGELTEEHVVRFADKSKLTVALTVKAGARPHETQAAQFAERVRRSLDGGA